ncbi:MAG TPA: hypothetical protein VMZ28_16025 [Kofleriaceae bacterium]|nr:hypothetical protein [Kofleriaceae bacterium]
MDADRLMALLYGELDAGDAERERAAVAESPEQAAELEGFERVRSLFRELPDEEPPPRISAQLLAEAARSAPAPRKAVAASREDGFWARLVSWLSPVQHPGFAAAASVVLVAGLAGVLYLRKGDTLQEAGRAPEAPPAESAAATGTATDEAPLPPAPAADPAVVAGQADLEGAAGEAQDRSRVTSADAKAVSKGGKTMPSKEKSLDLDDDVFAKKKREAKPAASSKKPDTLRGGTVYGLSEQEMMPGDAAGGSGGAPAANQAPPEPAPAPPQASTPTPAPSTKPSTKARPPTATELHARAVDAALDKRCSDVRTIGAEIRSIDPEYYKAKFAGDKRLKACLEVPSQYPARK